MITASVMKELNSKLCFIEVRRDLEFCLKNKPIEGISFNPIPNRGEGVRVGWVRPASDFSFPKI